MADTFAQLFAFVCAFRLLIGWADKNSDHMTQSNSEKSRAFYDACHCLRIIKRFSILYRLI